MTKDQKNEVIELAACQINRERKLERSVVMNQFNRFSETRSSSDLRRVIEPLANYICAADQPKAALMSALAVLVREVEATNRAARLHFRSVSNN